MAEGQGPTARLQPQIIDAVARDDRDDFLTVSNIKTNLGVYAAVRNFIDRSRKGVPGACFH
jgi:hypothetical protein